MRNRYGALLAFTLMAALLVVGTEKWLSQRTSPASSTSFPQYRGTDLGGVRAPTFSLRDQVGVQITLTELRGRPVVLTFLSTNCPNLCPIIAARLRASMQRLGEQADQVTWLVVSLDPFADTPEKASAFVEKYQFTTRLHYLLGTQPELEPIWNAYFVEVRPSQENMQPRDSATGVFLIDQGGHERIYLSGVFDPIILADHLRTLLKGQTPRVSIS